MSKAALKLAVAKRANGCCEYCKCQQRFSPDSFSIEHIVPRNRHGTDDESNLAFSCQGCNNNKYTATSGADPLTGEAVPLFHPRKQQWIDHFTWSDDFVLIVGITPTGRATVERLKLNREGVVNIRRALKTIGHHPI